MPPLEPTSYDSSRGSSPEAEELDDVARSVGDLSLTSPPTPDSAIQNQATPSSSTSPLADASTSSLHGTPNPEADVDMYDVDSVMSQETPVYSLPQTGSRRARVDEEEDEEDVRATNRQRMNSPDQSDDTHPQEPRPATPHVNPHQHEAPPDHPPPPYPGAGYLFSLDIFPGPGLNVPEQPPQGDSAQDQGHPHHHHHHHPPLPMFNFTFHIPVTPGAPAGEQAGANGAPPMPGFPPQFFPFAPGTEAFFMPFFPFGLPRQEEVDDPERAEKLIRGLEAVPEGLVTRIERFGGDGGDSVCSICWEKLSTEGGGFDELDQAGTDVDANARMDVDDRSAASPSPTEKPSTAKDLPKVVALPCSHVFHTSCLLPWFSKPHRTTCPSCRFDVDPESLTYVPPRQRRQQRGPSAQGPLQAPTGGQPPLAQAAANAQPAAAPAQAIPGVAPTPQPTSNAAPGEASGQQPRPGMPLEFNLFFPVIGGGQGGPAPPYIPLDAETTRNLFQRLFGSAPQPPQAPQEPPQGQQPRPAPAANPSARGPAPVAQDVPPAGGPDNWGIPNLWQNLFGVQPPRPPQGTANPATGAAPQRPASAASTGPRSQGRARPPEKRQWTPPPPPGQTLRQRVERMERERGLRCWDVSCGLGPTDEDPIPVIEPSTIRRISINKIGGHGEKVCDHTFHPSCLVSAERVAGWGAEDNKEEKEGEEEVEVSCPLCRTVGIISRADWDEGACALA